MSSQKRPLAEIRNAQTPQRYAPSTPHAIRALQQRSGAKTRSVRRKRAFSDTVRPDSARGILRQLAKLTAPGAKKIIPTPVTVRGKENRNASRRQSALEDDGDVSKRPRLALDIDDSLDDVDPPETRDEEDEDDSELLVAPTPSILPEEDDERSILERNDPTFTLKSILYGNSRQSLSKIDRRRSAFSSPGPARFAEHDITATADDTGVHDVDQDHTILSERGRRAPTVEPTENLSRYDLALDFDDFGTELEIKRASDQLFHTGPGSETQDDVDYLDSEGFEPLDVGGETERLKDLQNVAGSPSLAAPEASIMIEPPPEEESFYLAVPGEEVTSNHINGNHPAQPARADVAEDTPGSDGDLEARATTSPQQPPAQPSPVKSSSIPSTHSRRKKMKLTSHGEMVPSLPSSVIRRVALEAQARIGNRRPTLGKDHMKALEQATEWYFEQVGEDLAAFADHARRKKRLDRSDVLVMMRRQKILQGEGELEKAAQELLPRDAREDLDLEGAST